MRAPRPHSRPLVVFLVALGCVAVIIVLLQQARSPSTNSKRPGASPGPDTTQTTAPSPRPNGSLPVPVPTTGAYFGIQRDPGVYTGSTTLASREQVITDAERQIGRKFDIDHQFFRWGDSVPNAYVTWTASVGRYPFIDLNAAQRSGGFTSWADIASGSQDSYLKSLALSLKAWGKASFFSFNHEPESSICPGDDGVTCDRTRYYGTTEDYKAAWHRIISVFRGAGVTNLDYVWVSTGFRYTDSSDYRYGPKVYPGDDIIDWVASDPYNFILQAGQPADFARWRDLQDIIAPWYAWGLTTGKPMMLGEFGSLEDPASPTRRAAWFAHAESALKARFPRIKALNYYDNYRTDEPGNDWRLFGKNPTSLAAYRAWALDPYFDTRATWATAR